MRYIVDKPLPDFEFWSGAIHHAEMLTGHELDELDNILESEQDGNAMTETELNDMFWFDFVYVCSLIGLEYDDDNDKIIREHSYEG